MQDHSEDRRCLREGVGKRASASASAFVRSSIKNTIKIHNPASTSRMDAVRSRDSDFDLGCDGFRSASTGVSSRAISAMTCSSTARSRSPELGLIILNAKSAASRSTDQRPKPIHAQKRWRYLRRAPVYRVDIPLMNRSTAAGCRVALPRRAATAAAARIFRRRVAAPPRSAATWLCRGEQGRVAATASRPKSRVAAATRDSTECPRRARRRPPRFIRDLSARRPDQHVCRRFPAQRLNSRKTTRSGQMRYEAKIDSTNESAIAWPSILRSRTKMPRSRTNARHATPSMIIACVSDPSIGDETPWRRGADRRGRAARSDRPPLGPGANRPKSRGAAAAEESSEETSRDQRLVQRDRPRELDAVRDNADDRQQNRVAEPREEPLRPPPPRLFLPALPLEADAGAG